MANSFDKVGFQEWEKATALKPNMQLGGQAVSPMYADAPDGSSRLNGSPGSDAKAGWVLRQKIHQADPVLAREVLLAQIETGVGAFWLPVDGGIRSKGNRSGTRIWSTRAFEALLADVDLSEVSIQLEPRRNCLALAAAYAAFLQGGDTKLAKVSGGLGLDPIGTLAREGSLRGGSTLAMRGVASAAWWCEKNAPKMRALLVSTSAYHHAGASPEQEVQWAFATAMQYISHLHDDAKMTWSQAAGQVRFEMPVDNQFFVSMAKVRALRCLWERLLLTLGAEPSFDCHASTSERMLSGLDCGTNILRASGSVFASALSGATSVSCMPFDLPTGSSTPLSRRVARNTQTIFAEEGFLASVADPGAGSYLVEQLTELFSRSAWAYQQKVETRGDFFNELCSGRIHQVLDEQRDAQEGATATRTLHHVGVNIYVPADTAVEEPKQASAGNPWLEVKESDVDRHDALLDFSIELDDAKAVPETDARVFRAAISAFTAGNDVMSCQDLLCTAERDLFVEPISPSPLAAPWEALRRSSQRFLRQVPGASNQQGFRAVILRCSTSKDGSDFCESALAAAGFRCTQLQAGSPESFALPEGAPPWVAVICCSAEGREEFALKAVPKLKEAGVRLVYVFGASDGALSKVGVDGFLFQGCDLLTTMESLHRKLGVGGGA